MSGARVSGRGVVASAIPSDARDAWETLSRVPPGCDWFELRADRLGIREVAELVRRARVPVIVTVRRPEDGGTFGGSEDERRAVLVGALDAGAWCVDVEENGSLAAWAAGLPPERVILSHHGAPCRSDALGALFDRMRRHPARRLKIVPRAECPADGAAIATLLDRAERAGRTLAAFASGRAGFATRVLALSWGSWATYGAARRGRPTADGQAAAADLVETYRADRIGRETLRFGLAGRAVLESPSPFLHAAGYRETGLDAVYLPIEVDELSGALALCDREGPFRLSGLGVTAPFKEEAARAAVRKDPFVACCGAANTLLLEEGGFRAWNTDGPAALALVRRRLSPEGSVVAVTGAGGTARAAAVAFRDAGASVVLFNRTAPRAEAAAAALGVAWERWDALPDCAWDVLVQATPLGREGEEVVPVSGIHGSVIVDAAYGPRVTPLVATARKLGLTVFDGYDLLAAQATGQFHALTGQEAPVAAFEAASREVARSLA